MPALEQNRLLEACRALGEAVGGQTMLPPLIRDAGEGEASGGNVHYCAAGDAWIRFEARFDKAYVNRHEFPLKRLPLLIDCVLCDAERQPQAEALDEKEKFALLSAFFLATQTPIGVEPIEDTGEYRLTLRLSPTFVGEWRETFEPAALESCETLCRRVAASLSDKSREFFPSERVGAAVWSLRAAQELLGAPKLSPRAVEDFVAASLAEGREDRGGTPLPPVPRSRAEALELMISPSREPATIEAAAVETAPPAPAPGRGIAPRATAWRGAATGLVAALIPLTLMLSVGAFVSVYRKGAVEAARVEATDTRAAPPPAAASAPSEAAAATEPPKTENAHPAADHPPAQAAAAVAAKPAAAPRPFARRVAHAPAKSRHARNPFAQARRAVGRFATDVWDGISSIPRRLGGYSYYQDY